MPTLLKVIDKTIIFMFLKDFVNHIKKTNWVVALDLSQTLFNKEITDKAFQQYQNMRNKTPSLWKVQQICMKVVTRSSSEPLLEYNQNYILLTNQGWLWRF